MNLETVREEFESGRALLIDVREPDEWADGRIQNAIFLPWTKLRKEGVPDDLPRDKRIYIHCAAGVRAKAAAKLFRRLYDDVISLDDGIPDFQEAGFAIT